MSISISWRPCPWPQVGPQYPCLSGRWQEEGTAECLPCWETRGPLARHLAEPHCCAALSQLNLCGLWPVLAALP